ncbi:MAG: TetR family transcriptional regulator [Pseudoclavibacter sp.]|nr:TetR family transcriptional regulator [Pseudoclavibacter sp.]
MPRSSAEETARTARRTLETARGMFVEHGYTAVSLERIARAAGVTRGALYHHYGSKAGLFRAVASEVQAEVAEAVEAAAASAGGDAGEQLRAGSHAFLEAITSEGRARVLLVDAPAVLGWAQWLELDAAHARRSLHAVLGELGLPAPLVPALTAQLSGAMNEAALWLAQRPGDEAARRAAHEALERLLRAATP